MAKEDGERNGENRGYKRINLGRRITTCSTVDSEIEDREDSQERKGIAD